MFNSNLNIQTLVFNATPGIKKQRFTYLTDNKANYPDMPPHRNLWAMFILEADSANAASMLDKTPLRFEYYQRTRYTDS